MDPQVLIVGAGPVGLTLAIELARFGVPLRIIDKAAKRTDKSKAVCVWSRSLELFERAGIADSLVAAGIPVHAANVTTGTERIARISFDGLDTPFPFALMVPQSETERILEERLLALGVTVERETALLTIVDRGGTVEAKVGRPDGSEAMISASWMVGCDGAHSPVRHGLGLEFPGDTVETEFVLADIRLASPSLPPEELVIILHSKGIVALFPMPGGRTRLIASMAAPMGAGAPEPQLAEIQAILDERGPGDVVASDPVWMARFRINEREVQDFRVGRVFLAGDAAHVHSPAGGQGMNTGMQDAFNLAWKLALVCHGICHEGLLESYDPERSAVAARVIADAGRLTEIAMLNGPVAQAARNFIAHHLIGFGVVRHAVAETLAELAVAYDRTPLNGGHVGGAAVPAPGHRLSPLLGGSVGSADRPRFAIFSAGAPPEGWVDRFAGLVEATTRPPIDPGVILLARPDGYVAMSAEAGDWNAVEAYLSGWMAN